jgi:hypothetical protein
MLTVGSGLQIKCKINHLYGFEDCHRCWVAPLEYTMVADYSAEVNW